MAVMMATSDKMTMLAPPGAGKVAAKELMTLLGCDNRRQQAGHAAQHVTARA